MFHPTFDNDMYQTVRLGMQNVPTLTHSQVETGTACASFVYENIGSGTAKVFFKTNTDELLWSIKLFNTR